MLGMHGTYQANMAIIHPDVILAVGARFDDRVTGKIDEFAPHAKIIHIDIDPTSIQKNVRVDIPIVGDLKNVLRKMIKAVKAKKEASAFREKMSGWREAARRLGENPSAHLQDVDRRPDQAAIRGGADLQDHQGKRDHHHGGRPEPDVGRPVLQLRQAAHLPHVRGAGNDGIRPARRDRRPGGDARDSWSSTSQGTPASR